MNEQRYDMVYERSKGGKRKIFRAVEIGTENLSMNKQDARSVDPPRDVVTASSSSDKAEYIIKKRNKVTKKKRVRDDGKKTQYDAPDKLRKRQPVSISGDKNSAQRKGKSIILDSESEFVNEESDDENLAKRQRTIRMAVKNSEQRKRKSGTLELNSDFETEESDDERIIQQQRVRRSNAAHSAQRKGKAIMLNSDYDFVTDESDDDCQDSEAGSVRKRHKKERGSKERIVRRQRMKADPPHVKDKPKGRRKQQGDKQESVNFSGEDYGQQGGTDTLSDSTDSENVSMMQAKRHRGYVRVKAKKRNTIRGCGHYKGVVFRGSPRTLADVVKHLSSAQREAVKEMGLESILHFELDGVPTKIGYYVLSSYCASRNYMKILSGKFTIKPKDVHNVYGLQMGGRVIGHRGKSNSRNSLVKEWKSQFPEYKDNQVSLPKLGEKIKGMNGEAGKWFKLHFLVLFYTSLVECHQNGNTNPRILHFIDDVAEISKLNWCEFVVSVLQETVKNWNGNKRNSNFTGPLVFLSALYMDRVEDWHVQFDRQWPVIKGLTLEMMKKRVKSETDQGYFGLGAILARNNPIGDKHTDNGSQPERENTTGTDKVDLENATEAEMLIMMSTLTSRMEAAKHHYDLWYAKASKITAIQEAVRANHSVVISSMQFENQFETPPPMRTAPSCDDVDEQWAALNLTDDAIQRVINEACKDAFVEEFNDQFAKELDNQLNQSAEFEANPMNVRAQRNDCETAEDTAAPIPDLSLNVSARNSVDVHGNLPGDSARTTVPADTRRVINEDVGIQDSVVMALPVSLPKGAQINTDKEKVPRGLANQRAQRTKYMGRALSSPFDGSKTDMDRKIQDSDERMIKYIFDKNHTDNPCLFLWDKYVCSLKDFGTLASGNNVTHEVITVWCILQNHLEKKRLPGQPHRLFTSLVQTMFKVDNTIKDTNERMKIFSDTMTELLNDMSFINIKEVNMTFFPIFYNKHYFLVVFDMHNGTIDVLDNSKFGKGLEDKYGQTVHNLRDNYHMFLKSIGHAKADRLPNMPINCVQVPWSTSKNDLDSGLYMMRHMESYYGGGVHGWNSGFNKNATQRKIQLDKLRLLYLLDMLKWPLNERRIEVNKQTALYIQRTYGKDQMAESEAGKH